MATYESRPQQVEAKQFMGEPSFEAIAEWVAKNGDGCAAMFTKKNMNGIARYVLSTVLMAADIEMFDWIIINGNGVVFMANNDAFNERYDLADETLDPSGGTNENPLGD